MTKILQVVRKVVVITLFQNGDGKDIYMYVYLRTKIHIYINTYVCGSRTNKNSLGVKVWKSPCYVFCYGVGVVAAVGCK